MLYPLLKAAPIATILEAEPTTVPFPPNPVPKTRAHQREVDSVATSLSMGIRATVYGTLSINAELNAEIQRITDVAKAWLLLIMGLSSTET